MTTINIISGFLGAGKTTLIKKLINEVYKGEKLVLIENEFGEIGIDGGFLKDAGIEITEMNSGCICCSLVGDFGTALKEVLDRFTPDRILIEPSGVGKLSDVVKAVTDIAEESDVELAKSIVVADATKCKMYMKNFGEFYNNQVEHADVIVLSRTQNMSEDKLLACVKLLQEKNDKAAMITTPWDELEGAQLLAAMSGKNAFADELMVEAEVCPHCGHVHEHHEHDHEHEHHHHDHDEECCCGHEHEHHHNHDEECCCGHDHHHDYEHEHHHHHDHDEECCCGHDHHHEHEHGHHHHHADEVFTSWGKESPHKYEEAALKNILDKLANTEEYGVILRAKGIVPATDGRWFYFDLVPGEAEVREGQPDYTGRLCVIGAELKEDLLAELFEIQ